MKCYLGAAPQWNKSETGRGINEEWETSVDKYYSEMISWNSQHT